MECTESVRTERLNTHGAVAAVAAVILFASMLEGGRSRVTGEHDAAAAAAPARSAPALEFASSD